VSQAVTYIKRLEDLKEGERSRLRRLAGMPLDATLPGFDLFTGLWWPLRAKNQATPRRETSWLVAKLYASFRIPHTRPDSMPGPMLPAVLGICEPYDEYARPRFRARFDALLCSPLPVLEPHLQWALSEVARAVAGRVPHAKGVTGIDWAQLLDDLSIWDRTDQHRRKRDIRDIWVEAYLNSTDHTKRRA